MNPGFPNLQIIPVNSLMLHEEIDRKRVEKYMKAFTKSKCLFDPPIVTKIRANRYLVLDGANRVTVFKKLLFLTLLSKLLSTKSLSLS